MNLLKGLKINGRVDKVLNFDSDDESNNHYVVKPQAGSPITLIELGAKENYVSSESAAGNLTFSDVDKKVSTDCMTIKIALGPKLSQKFQNGRNGSSDFEGIIYGTNQKDSATKMLQLLLKRKAEEPLHIKLEFGIGETIDKIDRKKTVHIYVVDVVYDAIVDFGSEASQACWLKDSPNPSFINLTASIRNASGKASKHDNDFVQYEYDVAEDKMLYRSIYYLKKELGDTDLNGLNSWPNYEKDTVRFLREVNDEDFNEYIQIPNIKLLNFKLKGCVNNRVTVGGIEYEIKEIKEGVIPTMVMNNIIFQTLQCIEHNINATCGSGKSCGLVLNILMPNVYPIHMVSQKLNRLAKDIEGIRSIIPHIKGVELRYISESDASLLGYINKNTGQQTFEEGNYLIVDVGKGTLDFSLIELKRQDGLTNKRRGGIVGAGAAITYGVLVGLVNEYLTEYCKGYDVRPRDEKDSLIRTFIYEQILKCDDIAKLNATMDNIEEYKKTYNDFYGKGHGIISPDAMSGDFDELKLNDGAFCFNNVLKDWISKRHNLSEESSIYVTAEIEMIVREAMKRMKSVLNKEKAMVVVFAGRGCLMKELRVRLKEELLAHGLLEKSDGNELVSLKTMKTGCMHINQLLRAESYDTAESHQSFSVLDPIEESGEKKQKKKRVEATQDEKSNWGDRLRKEMEDEGIVRGTINVALKINGALKPFRTVSEGYGNLAQGTELGTINSAFSRINIGGWYYSIHKNFVNKRCKLLFDGSHYIIVSDGVEPQELDDKFIEGSQDAELGFESLFPNISIQNAEMVVIPKMDEMVATEEAPAVETKETEKKDAGTSDGGVGIKEVKFATEDWGNKIGKALINLFTKKLKLFTKSSKNTNPQ